MTSGEGSAPERATGPEIQFWPGTEDPMPQIRYLGDMQRVRAEPDDLFVLTLGHRASYEERRQLAQYWESFADGRRLLILDQGMRLGVVSGPSGPEEARKIIDAWRARWPEIAAYWAAQS